MPLPYQVWLRQEAYDYLDSIEMAERQRLLGWVERLGGQPDRDGDFTEPESDGRDWKERCRAFSANSPPDWKGIHRLETR